MWFVRKSKYEKIKKELKVIKDRIDIMQKDINNNIEDQVFNDSKESYGFCNGVISTLSFLKGEELEIITRPEYFMEDFEEEDKKRKSIIEKRKNIKK